MTSISYFKGKAADARLVFELNEEDACAIFDRGMRDGETPVMFLRELAEERRRLEKWRSTAQISVVVFLFILFFLRRFIP